MNSVRESEPSRTSPLATFISIPRNGSHSVRQALGLGPNRDLDTVASEVIDENHQRGAVLAERYGLAGSFVFCMARHPYSRCLSWYRFHRHLEPYRSLSFEHWVANGLPHHWLTQNATDYYTTGLSPLLQHTFVTGCQVDYIGRVEHFDESLASIVERLNALRGERGLPPGFRTAEVHHNASPPEPAVEQLESEHTRRAVHELLRTDYEHFGYEL